MKMTLSTVAASSMFLAALLTFIQMCNAETDLKRQVMWTQILCWLILTFTFLMHKKEDKE